MLARTPRSNLTGLVLSGRFSPVRNTPGDLGAGSRAFEVRRFLL